MTLFFGGDNVSFEEARNGMSRVVLGAGAAGHIYDYVAQSNGSKVFAERLLRAATDPLYRYTLDFLLDKGKAPDWLGQKYEGSVLPGMPNGWVICAPGKGTSSFSVGYEAFGEQFTTGVPMKDTALDYPFDRFLLDAAVIVPSYLARVPGGFRAAAARAATIAPTATVAGQGHAPMTGYTWNQVLQARYGAENVMWVQPKLPSEPLTIGVLRTPAGDFDLASGWRGYAGMMPKGSPGFDIVTRTHVEGQAAALMQRQGIGEGVLYINNPIICPNCTRNLPYMLGRGRTLQVVLPKSTPVPFTGVAR
jgi:hypothetical protein